MRRDERNTMPFELSLYHASFENDLLKKLTHNLGQLSDLWRHQFT